jgi:hypothetical protein
MAAIGYRLLGLAVWRSFRWYLRSRLPLGRLVFGVLLGTAAAIAAAARAAKRPRA